jgi:hypothetical protein
VGWCGSDIDITKGVDDSHEKAVNKQVGG